MNAYKQSPKMIAKNILHNKEQTSKHTSPLSSLNSTNYISVQELSMNKKNRLGNLRFPIKT